jgi:hypothetical protein
MAWCPCPLCCEEREHQRVLLLQYQLHSQHNHYKLTVPVPAEAPAAAPAAWEIE